MPRKKSSGSVNVRGGAPVSLVRKGLPVCTESAPEAPPPRPTPGLRKQQAAAASRPPSRASVRLFRARQNLTASAAASCDVMAETTAAGPASAVRAVARVAPSAAETMAAAPAAAPFVPLVAEMSAAGPAAGVRAVARVAPSAAETMAVAPAAAPSVPLVAEMSAAGPAAGVRAVARVAPPAAETMTPVSTGAGATQVVPLVAPRAPVRAEAAATVVPVVGRAPALADETSTAVLMAEAPVKPAPVGSPVRTAVAALVAAPAVPTGTMPSEVAQPVQFIAEAACAPLDTRDSVRADVTTTRPGVVPGFELVAEVGAEKTSPYGPAPTAAQAAALRSKVFPEDETTVVQPSLHSPQSVPAPVVKLAEEPAAATEACTTVDPVTSSAPVRTTSRCADRSGFVFAGPMLLPSDSGSPVVTERSVPDHVLPVTSHVPPPVRSRVLPGLRFRSALPPRRNATQGGPTTVGRVTAVTALDHPCVPGAGAGSLSGVASPLAVTQQSQTLSGPLDEGNESLAMTVSYEPSPSCESDGVADTDEAQPVAASGTLPSVKKRLLDTPCDGVYTLSTATQARISTLLRALFVVQATSDKCILPFLAMAHYMMAFSSLVGASSATARSEFFDALRVAFQHPSSMKQFMEASFRCSRHGLHVGGRTGYPRHVAGQPSGLCEEDLRQRINPNKVKVQWLSRRLSLRVHVDVQRGVRSLTGGLTGQDRETVLASLDDATVCSKLRERGCSVKYSKEGPSGKKPQALSYRWNSANTWFHDGLEAGLVDVLRSTLLKLTPVACTDRELDQNNLPKTAFRPFSGKRAAPSTSGGGQDVEAKRPRNDSEPSTGGTSSGCCSKCGGASDDAAVTPALSPTTGTSPGEHWSADVDKSAALPHGGHIVSFTLPMHMDAGPGGRQHVFVEVCKQSSAGSSVNTYTMFVKVSTRPPERVADVPGAAYAPLSGQVSAPTSQSWDLLRAVKTFLMRRSGSETTVSDEPHPSVQLTVRYASPPVPLVRRFRFVSEYELSSRGELVERFPGRMTIFLVGRDPLPVGGSFVL